MKPGTTLILYSRPDCHLCELAAQQLDSYGASWQEVDIEDDLNLIRKYGNHIPVLYRADIDRALYWPFDVVTLQDFIELEI